MRLLVISHTPHYLRDGEVTGWGPTVREIDHLAGLFEEVVHLAPLHKESAPRSAMAYGAANVRLRAVPNAGGQGLPAKLQVMARYPKYAAAIAEEMGRCDVVHVRCPSNIGMLASIMLVAVRRPRRRWIKYAGNWRPESCEAWSYGVQRWWLRKGWHRGVVTVNGEWAGDPAHVHSFLNPCLTDQELEEARLASEGKEMSRPVRLLYVGRLDVDKGIGRAVEIAHRLNGMGIFTRLDVVGDGPARAEAERLAEQAIADGRVRFHGWLARPELAPLYAAAHILLLPTSSSEGWPKVLSEGMAYGAVPVAGAVSSIPQLLLKYGTGRSHAAGDVDAFARAIAGYAEKPHLWQQESTKASGAAAEFTYSRHVERVAKLLAVKRAPDDGYRHRYLPPKEVEGLRSAK